MRQRTQQARIARCVERGKFRHKSKQSNTQDEKGRCDGRGGRKGRNLYYMKFLNLFYIPAHLLRTEGETFWKQYVRRKKR